MERFLRADGPTVASLFAPITFAPASVLVYRVDAKGRQVRQVETRLYRCGTLRRKNIELVRH